MTWYVSLSYAWGRKELWWLSTHMHSSARMPQVSVLIFCQSSPAFPHSSAEALEHLLLPRALLILLCFALGIPVLALAPSSAKAFQSWLVLENTANRYLRTCDQTKTVHFLDCPCDAYFDWLRMVMEAKAYLQECMKKWKERGHVGHPNRAEINAMWWQWPITPGWIANYS